MARINSVMNVPKAVKNWFTANFKGSQFTFKFYWYRGLDNRKVYGCKVFKDGELWSYIHQATEEEFKTMPSIN